MVCGWCHLYRNANTFVQLWHMSTADDDVAFDYIVVVAIEMNVERFDADIQTYLETHCLTMCEQIIPSTATKAQ